MKFSMYNFPLKIFVREENIREDNSVNKLNNTTQTLTGDSAKEFYESIINEVSTAEPKPATSCKKNKTRSVPRNIAHQKFAAKDIWKFAQNNDYTSLERLLTDNENLSIDCKDPFGWTPLMCAACSGAKECVEILINKKADPNICDKSGNTAFILAKKNNFPHIVNILKNGSSRTAKNEKKNVEEIFCQTCNSVFHTNVKNHECSTLHLFNNPGPTRTFYGIPESNKGFQMLLRNGWDKEKGLGLNECGIRFPIKAKKKNDRVGFGGVLHKIKSTSNDGNNVKKRKMRIGQQRVNNNLSTDFSAGSNECVMEDPKKSLKYLEQLESLGEEILIDRQEIIALDKRRNQTREGLQAIRKCKTEKSWFALGPILMKLPSKVVEDLLKKDQIQVDSEINKIRSNLKVKVNDLRDMEHCPPVPGLMLNALSRDEMKAFGQVLGRHAD